MVLVGLNACSRTIRIRDLLDRPQEYDGKTVQVEGTVTQSIGVLGTGAFEIDDGTGKIFVIARGQGVPREGAKTKAKGRLSRCSVSMVVPWLPSCRAPDVGQVLRSVKYGVPGGFNIG
jgi:hypothetical protein